MNDHERFMRAAITEARIAAEVGEVPVGAVLVAGGKIIARTHNLTERLVDVTAHAEIQAITAASSYLASKYLNKCTLYVTLEPCPMCAHAISISRLDALHFAAEDPKGGGVIHGPKIFESSSCHHKPEVKYGLMADESSKLLRSFFKSKRLK